jgi:CHASE2 domain-containing sensor protein
MRLAQRLRVLLIAAVVAAAAVGGAAASGALGALEDDALDARFALRAAERPDDIVVVAVDDATFSDLGLQWPFPRSIFADATDRLQAAGAREIVLDVQFTEETEPEEDLALFDAVDRAGGAVLATSESDAQGRTRVLGGDRNLREIGAVAAAANLPEDDRGVVRRFERAVGRLPTLAATVAARAGRPAPPDAFGADGSAYIDFAGPPGTIRTVSFSDVVRGRVDPAVLRGRIVVVGASAATLQDLHATSADRRTRMAGPEIQANAILTALRGVPLRRAPGWIDVLAVAGLILLVPLASLKLGIVAAGAVGAAGAAAYAGGAQLLFLDGTVVAVAAPLLGLVAAMVTTGVAGQLIERGERRRVDAVNRMLETAVRDRIAELDALQLEVIERLGRAVDSRDEETGEHIERITTLSHRLALAAGMDADRAEMLRRASAMHDVGKVTIPDAVLLYGGRFSPEQRAIMETHTTVGAGILAGSRSPLVRMAEQVALTHHERWDGSGYPHGLAGEDIPLEGRIVAICDFYDALISRRPYKEPWTPQAALAEIADQAGRHFDPRLARLFVAMMAPEVGAAADAAAPGEPVRAAA